MAQSMRQSSAGKLLEMLPKGGPNPFDVFVHALQLTTRPLYLVNELRKQENELAAERKTAPVVEKQLTPTEGRRHTDRPP